MFNWPWYAGCSTFHLLNCVHFPYLLVNLRLVFSFVRLFVRSVGRSVDCSFVPIVRSLVRSFVHSLSHSFASQPANKLPVSPSRPDRFALGIILFHARQMFFFRPRREPIRRPFACSLIVPRSLRSFRVNNEVLIREMKIHLTRLLLD